MARSTARSSSSVASRLPPQDADQLTMHKRADAQGSRNAFAPGIAGEVAAEARSQGTVGIALRSAACGGRALDLIPHSDTLPIGAVLRAAPSTDVPDETKPAVEARRWHRAGERAALFVCKPYVAVGVASPVRLTGAPGPGRLAREVQ
jgi:hypothetical protein